MTSLRKYVFILIVLSLITVPLLFYAEGHTNTPTDNNYGLYSDGVVVITDEDNPENVATYDARDLYKLANGVDGLIAEDVSGKGLLTSTLLEYGIDVAEMGDTSNALASDSVYHTEKIIPSYESIDRYGYIPNEIEIELPTLLSFDNVYSYTTHNATVSTYSGIDDGIRRLAQLQYDRGFVDGRLPAGTDIELTEEDYVVSTINKNVVVTKDIPDGWYEGKGVSGTIDASAIYNKGKADGLAEGLHSSNLQINYHVHTTSGGMGQTRTASSYTAYQSAKASLSSATSQSTSGGCYTTAYNHYHSESCYTGCGYWQPYERHRTYGLHGPESLGVEPDEFVSTSRCSRCGAFTSNVSYNFNDTYPSYPSGHHCHGSLTCGQSEGTGYRLSCGHNQGDIVSILVIVS